MSDAAFVGGEWAARHFLCKRRWSLGIWRQWAPGVQGQAMKGGHFFPEESPDDTAVLIKKFLST
jgi:haloacetate dehalogenase